MMILKLNMTSRRADTVNPSEAILSSTKPAANATTMTASMHTITAAVDFTALAGTIDRSDSTKATI